MGRSCLCEQQNVDSHRYAGHGHPWTQSLTDASAFPERASESTTHEHTASRGEQQRSGEARGATSRAKEAQRVCRLAFVCSSSASPAASFLSLRAISFGCSICVCVCCVPLFVRVEPCRRVCVNVRAQADQQKNDCQQRLEIEERRLTTESTDRSSRRASAESDPRRERCSSAQLVPCGLLLSVELCCPCAYVS